MNNDPHDSGLREEQTMIELHDQAHYFLGTQLGRKFMHDIDSEVEEFIEQLKKADPEKPAEVKKLQDEIWKREYLKIWFNTILLQGQAVLEAHESIDMDL